MSKASRMVYLFWNHNSIVGNLIFKLAFSTATYHSLSISSIVYSVLFFQQCQHTMYLNGWPNPPSAKPASYIVHSLYSNLKIRVNISSCMIFILILIYERVIFYKNVDTFYFYSTEVTKMGILFGYNTFIVETKNNCKYLEVKHTHAYIYLPNYPFIHTHSLNCKFMKQYFSLHFRSIT